MSPKKVIGISNCDYIVRISGGATVWHLGKLYLVGGYTVEYDVELKSFYQNPSNSVWVFDPAKGIWSQGPSLPRFNAFFNLVSYTGFSPGGRANTFFNITRGGGGLKLT